MATRRVSLSSGAGPPSYERPAAWIVLMPARGQVPRPQSPAERFEMTGLPVSSVRRIRQPLKIA